MEGCLSTDNHNELVTKFVVSMTTSPKLPFSNTLNQGIESAVT